MRKAPFQFTWIAAHPIGAAIVNCIRLLWFLIVAPPAWIYRFTLMLWFIIALSPGFFQVAYYYLTTDNVLRNVHYGPNPRNFMDIYLPTTKSSKPAPVIILFCGGMWIIGYKAWGGLMGRILAANGILSIMPDYRNFPQGSMSDMLTDVHTAIQYAFDTLEDYGGDVSQVSLVGHSAGAHLVLTALLLNAKDQAIKAKEHTDGGGPQWRYDAVRRLIAISGPYNITTLEEHFHRRGLYRRILRAIFEGNYPYFSPTNIILNDPLFSDSLFAASLPDIYLFHGATDNAVPQSDTLQFHEALKTQRIRCNLRIYPGKSHTDSILEDLMNEEEDQNSDLMSDIVSIVQNNAMAIPGLRRRPSFYQGVVGAGLAGRLPLVPRSLLKVARRLNPF